MGWNGVCLLTVAKAKAASGVVNDGEVVAANTTAIPPGGQAGSKPWTHQGAQAPTPSRRSPMKG